MSYDEIQDLIDEGRQLAAEELGPPHDVYRFLNPDINGNVLIAGNKIASLISIYTKIGYGGGIRTSFEAEKQQGIIWYEIIADMSPFRLGDVFILNDPVYGAGYSSVNFPTNEFKGFALADHSPIKKALGGRLNCTVTIFRPSVGPNSNMQWDKNKDWLDPLVLANGAWGLGVRGATPTKVPAGLTAMGRTYGDKMFSSPAAKRGSGWELYVPALKGFDAQEGDKIVGPDGARYTLIIPYTQKVGATGSQWFLEREAP